jgi:hypothetical protein
MGHVLVVPEPAKGFDNGCMIHNMKLLNVSSGKNPKSGFFLSKYEQMDLKTAIVLSSHGILEIVRQPSQS